MSKDAKARVITRRVSPEDLRELLTSPPRANLAFVDDGRVDAMPVDLRYENDRYFCCVIDLPAGLVPGAPVHLLADDGEFYAELRGIAIAGRVGDRPTSPSESAATNWLEVVPDRMNAWNYGAMRRRTQ